MFIDGIKLGEGSDIQNLTIATGTSHPTNPSVGELFFRTDVPTGLFVYDGSTWIKVIFDEAAFTTQASSKKSVIAATTENIALSTALTIDGINTSVGDRVLVKDQTDPIENGIYIVQTGLWARAEDFTAAAGEYVFVSGGTTQATTIWMLTNLTNLAISTDEIIFAMVAGVNYTGGDGISLSGTEPNITIGVYTNPTGAIEVNIAGQLDLVDLTANSTYGSVTVDTYGRVTGAGNFTTLAEYQIEDAQPLATILTDITAAEAASTDGALVMAGGIASFDTELSEFSAVAVAGGPGPGYMYKNGAGWFFEPSLLLDELTTFTVTDVDSNLSGTGTYDALEINLSVTGITAGTYKSVTVDIYGRITAATNPTTLDGYGITDAYTKTQVDTLLAGLDIRASVRAATTANITLSAPQTIDGISVVAGNRVLVKNQTTASENGIYVVAASAWTRAADANTSAELSSGTYCFVEEGTVNADSGLILITDGTITLDTTALTFTQFNGLGQVTAGTGLTKSGNTISLSSGVATAGTYNNVTVDTYGRVTVGSNVSYLTANQSITLSGDITGTGSTAITTTLANSGVTAGTYKSVTVDVKGRVTAGTNPTTLAGYGITDAPVINPGSPKDGDIKIAAGPIISIYASAAWRQIWPAVYS